MVQPTEEKIEENDKPVKLDSETVDAELKKLAKENNDLRNQLSDLFLRESLAHEAQHVAVLRAESIDDVGKYIAPIEDTLASHYHIVLDRNNDISYTADSPFYNVVEQIILDDAFSNPNHPHYYDYENVRDNMAVLVNVILSQESSGKNTKDPAFQKDMVKKLEFMGGEIAKAIQRGNGFHRPFTSTLDAVELSQPGIGAVKMYEFLLKKQESNKSFHWVKKMFGYDFSNWKLPPIEQTAFSEQNVRFFEAHDVLPDGTLSLPGAQQTPEQHYFSPIPMEEPLVADTNTLLNLSDEFAITATELNKVRNLPEPVKQESIEIARDILEKLRFKVGGSAPRGEWSKQNPADLLEEANALLSVGDIYSDLHNNTLLSNPNAAQDPILQTANNAFGELAVVLKEEAALQLEAQGNYVDAALVFDQINALPDHWKGDNPNMATLIDRMAMGIEQAAALQLTPEKITLAQQSQQKEEDRVFAALEAQQQTLHATETHPKAGQEQNVAPASFPLSPEPIKLNNNPPPIAGLSKGDLDIIQQMRIGNATRSVTTSSATPVKAATVVPDPQQAQASGFVGRTSGPQQSHRTAVQPDTNSKGSRQMS